MPERVFVSHRAGDVARSELHRGTVMSKRKSGKRSRLAASAKGSRRKIAIILVMLALIAAGVTAASWSVIKSRSAEPQPQQPSLAKEYIYAGGRLVATEEPPGTSLSPPVELSATATSTTQVSLTWTAPTQGTVDHYEVWRTQSLTLPYSLAGSSTSTTFTDSSVTGGVTYLYKVRAVGPEENFSDYSDVNMATTIIFTDDPLTAGVTQIKAPHVTELRQAVNAVRVAANLTAASWTDSSLQGVAVKAVHISELRTNLNAALSALGFSAPPYTDPTLVFGTTVVKKIHVEELRQRVK